MTMYSISSDLRRLLAEQTPNISSATRASTSRVIPISHARHMRGVHPVRPNHPPVPVESRLELQFVSFLAQLAQFRTIRSQPITINHVFNGKAGRYTPDFLVELSNVPEVLARLGFATRTYVEIKPLVRAIKDRDLLTRKFSALRRATSLPVTLVTDADLRARMQEVRHGT